MKKTLQFVAAVLIVAGMFSCNVIDKKRYSGGYYFSSYSNRKAETQNKVVKESKNDFAKKEKVNEVTDNFSNEVKSADAIPEITAEATIAAADIAVDTKVKPVHKKKKTTVRAVNKPLFVIKSSKLAVSLIQMQEKKLMDRSSESNQGGSDTDLILLVILAILLPPVAVFLKRGLDVMFWISLLLTLIFWFPGVIFALLVVFDAI
jgi:uncharacterized membrane protein YqaE (UPF0057 family)